MIQSLKVDAFSKVMTKAFMVDQIVAYKWRVRRKVSRQSDTYGPARK